MKKILLLIVSLFILLLFLNTSFGNGCIVNIDSFNDSNINLGEQLNKCLEGSYQINGEDVKLDGGFAIQIQKWVNNISLYLGILAVGTIVYGAFNMTLSAGEDEKIKKSKDIIKWGIIGFVGLISITAIITLIIKIMYSI